MGETIKKRTQTKLKEGRSLVNGVSHEHPQTDDVKACNSKQNSESYVQLLHEGSKYLALVDTGASVTIADSSLIEHNSGLLKPYFGVVKGVSGSDLEVLGVQTMEITIGSSKLKHDVIIIKRLDSEKFIIGRDLMKACDCVINFSNLTFTIRSDTLPLLKISKHDYKPKVFHARAAKTVRLKPFHYSPVPVSLNTNRGQCHLSITGTYEPVFSFNKHSLSAPPSLLNFNKGKCNVVVYNNTHETVCIFKKQKLGRINLCAYEAVKTYNAQNTTDLNGRSIHEGNKTKTDKWDGKIQDLYTKLALSELTHLTESQHTAVRDLIFKYRDIFAVSDDDLGAENKNIPDHKIILKDQNPIRCKYRPIPMARRKAAELEVQRLMDLNIIEPSTSTYHSPAFLISKGNRFRVVADLRKLNDKIFRSYTPIPSLQSVVSGFAGCKYFSRMDFNMGYHQANLEKQSRPYTACSIPQVAFFQWVKVPLGLSSAPPYFQSMVEKQMMGLKNSACVVFLDDLASGGKDFDTMYSNLEKIFQRLKESGLILKPQKCRIFQTEMQFLGYKLSARGLTVDPEKTEAITKMIAPKNKKALKSFLGMASFYRRFVLDFSKIARPLTELLKKDVRWAWSEVHEKAFNDLRAKLVAPPILRFPDASKPYTLTVDASQYCIGSVLSQKCEEDGKLHPVAFASNVLNKTQQKWSSFQRELFSLKFYCEKFREYLLNTHFTVQTDHQALVHWKSIDVSNNQKLWRWFQKLSNFTFDVVHLPGSINQSDGPSRLPKSNDPLYTELPDYVTQHIPEKLTTTRSISVQTDEISCFNISKVSVVQPLKQRSIKLLPSIPEESEINIEPYIRNIVSSPSMESEEGHSPAIMCTDDTLLAAQEADESLKQVKEWVKTKVKPTKHEMEMMNSDLKSYWHAFNRLTVKDGLLYRSWESINEESPTNLICVPKSMQTDIIKACHDPPSAAHFGIPKTKQRIMSRFYWPHLELHVKLFVDSCKACVLRKKSQKPKSALIPYNSGAPGELITIDLLENLPPAQGYTSILVMVDRFTFWAMAEPLKTTVAPKIAKVILDKWICSKSVPYHIHSDRAGNLHGAEVLKALYSLMGISKTATPSYRPQSDGGSERLIRTIKSMLWSYCQSNPKNWVHYLNQCMFAYNTSQHSASTYSPFFLEHGRLPRLPIDIMFSTYNKRYFDSHGAYGYHLFKTLTKTYDFVHRYLKTNRDSMKRSYDKGSLVIDYKPGDLVYVYRPTPPEVYRAKAQKFYNNWAGPYPIQSKVTEFSYKLKLNSGDRMYDIVHHDRLRRAPREDKSREPDDSTPTYITLETPPDERAAEDPLASHENLDNGPIIHVLPQPPVTRRSQRTSRPVDRWGY